jgi:hypothetical protein
MEKRRTYETTEFTEKSSVFSKRISVTKWSIIDQTYSSKISPDPSFPKRGNSSLL